MQIPILSGIFTDENSDFRTSYPRNMIPVPKSQGISEGYLRPADGIDQIATGSGKDRGAINWRDECYRVQGNSLIKVNSDFSVSVIGNIAGSGLVTMDYSFDRLAIAGGGNLYFYDGLSLAQVSDPDLGRVDDALWVDGYFMTTDGESLVVTELNDPTQVNPLKYGSSEVDPDPVKAILKVRNEPHALNRYTIEAFDNVGGVNFPFQRIDGAQIQRGTIGTHTCTLFLESFAFMGGARNEAISVWLGGGGQSVKIATREVDQILEGYTEKILSESLMECRVYNGHQHLYIHLPDQTIVYDASASRDVGQPVWFILTGGTKEKGQYPACNFVYCYNKWIVGDPSSNKIGALTSKHSNQWSDIVTWSFSTGIIYNESRGAIFHELELVCLTGRSKLGENSTLMTQYSKDGVVFSQPKYIKTGGFGNRNKRLVWLFQGMLRNWRMQKFTGTSDAHISVARMQARIEPMYH